MEILFLFVVKIFDNILATSKTILIQNNRKLMAALNVFISQIIFYKLISAVLSDSGDSKIYIVALASSIGTYLAIYFNDKFSKDKLYVNMITSDDREAMTELCNYLREHKLKNLVTDSYTKDWGKTLAVTIYAQTKNDSRLIDEYIEKSDKKYLRTVN